MLFCLFCTQTSLRKSNLQCCMYRIQQKRDVSPFFREKSWWKYCEDEIVKLNSRFCHQTSNLHCQVDNWHLNLTKKLVDLTRKKLVTTVCGKIMAYRPGVGQGRFSIFVWNFLSKVKSISVKSKNCLLNSNLHRQVVNWHLDLTKKTCENSVH